MVTCFIESEPNSHCRMTSTTINGFSCRRRGFPVDVASVTNPRILCDFSSSCNLNDVPPDSNAEVAMSYDK